MHIIGPKSWEHRKTVSLSNVRHGNIHISTQENNMLPLCTYLYKYLVWCHICYITISTTYLNMHPETHVRLIEAAEWLIYSDLMILHNSLVQKFHTRHNFSNVIKSLLAQSFVINVHVACRLGRSVLKCNKPHRVTVTTLKLCQLLLFGWQPLSLASSWVQ